MIFEWDTAKAASNLEKHGLTFETATRVWDDPLYEIRPDRVVEGEERWHAIGRIGAELIVVVVHTYPDVDDDQTVRIISARKATRFERRLYEQDNL
jgi:hypothetical protein